MRFILALGWPSYCWPDLAALAVVLFCALRGWRRGLSGELAGLVTILAAVLLAMRLREPLALTISRWTRMEVPAGRWLAFMLVGVAALIILALICRGLRRIMQLTFTPGLERGGGMAAGIARGAVLVTAVFILLNMWPRASPDNGCGQKSWTGRQVRRALPRLREHWNGQGPLRVMAPETEGGEQP